MTPIEAQNIVCQYGRRPVVRDLSLSVDRGQVLVLLGANGSGKTTVLRALAQLMRPASGVVALEGEDVWQQRAAQVARRLAMSPQVESREWPISVEQIVLLGRSPHRGWLVPFNQADRAAADKAIRRCGLEKIRQRVVTELSGGEWRRVILAQTLTQEPRILLLDEPLAGLDLKFQYEFVALLRKLADEHQLAVVVTMHDLNLAAMLADRVGLLADGRLLACGPVDQTLTAEKIRRTFDIDVAVFPHPTYGTPMVAPLLSVAARSDTASSDAVSSDAVSSDAVSSGDSPPERRAADGDQGVADDTGLADGD